MNNQIDNTDQNTIKNPTESSDDWKNEKKSLDLPPHLTKDRCIHGATEAGNYEFKVDPFVGE